MLPLRISKLWDITEQTISDVTTMANTCIDLIFTNMNTHAHGSIFTAVSHHHVTYTSFEDTEVQTYHI